MAQKIKQRQVAEVIKRGFSTVLQNRGSYIYGNTIVSVTNVFLSPDMRVAKIYLSIFNTQDKDSVLELIQSHYSSLKQDLVKLIRNHVRVIPEIRIFKDDILDEMYRIDQMFDDLKKEELN